MLSSVSRLTRLTRVSKSLKAGRSFSSSINDTDSFVVGVARTPIGKLGGSLSGFTAPQLGAHAISSALEQAKVDKSMVEEAFMGNVVSSGIGQAPTRQSVIYAGLPLDVPSTGINKVCASGMKALMMASMSIGSGYRHTMIAGKILFLILSISLLLQLLQRR